MLSQQKKDEVVSVGGGGIIFRRPGLNLQEIITRDIPVTISTPRKMAMRVTVAVRACFSTNQELATQRIESQFAPLQASSPM